MKEHVQQAQFVAISCDEVTSCDSGQWLCIHVYVVLDWVRISLLLNIAKVEGQGADSLFAMIESALLEEGGLSERRLEKNSFALEQIVSMCFRGVTIDA